MPRSVLLVAFVLAAPALALADRPLLDKPDDPSFAKFQPERPPSAEGLLLKQGDRLAICGDSITEQRMYSRLMEDYLMVCVPELNVTVRQYGWSGERAGGFLNRMRDDCLRFEPTVATTCYGMNDHEYKPFEERIGERYRTDEAAIMDAFKAAGTRPVLGSAGCVGKMPSWVKEARGTVEDLNLSLCTLRNIDIDLAQQEHVRFADVFWPMFTAAFEAHKRYGPDYAVAGKDGVHPGWAGHTIMAYAFLKALGLDGNLGAFTVDYQTRSALVSEGHELEKFENGELRIKSRRYPICATGDPAKDNSIRSGMTLVPFRQELNRLTLIVRNGPARNYEIAWGGAKRSYSAEQLATGVNLAADFEENPFCAAFKAVDDAVAAKEEYETREIKEIFHGLLADRYHSAEEIKDAEMKELFQLRDAGGKLDRDAVIKACETHRAALEAAVHAACVPVEHTLQITPL